MIYLKRSLGFFIRVFTINFIPSGQLLSFLCPFTVRFREHSPNKPLLIFLSNYFCDYRPFFSSTFAMSAEPQGGRAIAPQSIPSPCSDHALARPLTAALVLHQRALEVAVEVPVSPGHPWGAAWLGTDLLLEGAGAPRFHQICPAWTRSSWSALSPAQVGRSEPPSLHLGEASQTGAIKVGFTSSFSPDVVT